MNRIPADQRRALLVQAALRVIAKQGVSGATTRAIVAEAGAPDARVVTADRGLRRRIDALGAVAVGPRWLWDRLDA